MERALHQAVANQYHYEAYGIGKASSCSEKQRTGKTGFLLEPHTLEKVAAALQVEAAILLSSPALRN